MIGEGHKINAQLETLIDIVEGVVTEEGYETKRVSDMKNFYMTEYDGLIIRDCKGKEFKICFEESRKYNFDKQQWEGTNYLKEDL